METNKDFEEFKKNLVEILEKNNGKGFVLKLKTKSKLNSIEEWILWDGSKEFLKTNYELEFPYELGSYRYKIKTIKEDGKENLYTFESKKTLCFDYKSKKFILVPLELFEKISF